jgi:uncharacterized membrane-anchored protein YhcB (DUF1043 family)
VVNLVRNKKRLLLAVHYAFFILITGLLIAIIATQARNHWAQQERMTSLEDTAKEQFAQQTELLLENGRATVELKEALAVTDQELKEVLAKLTEQVALGTRGTGEQTDRTDIWIQQIDKVYSRLLAEQGKWTLDTLYTEAVLIEKEQVAARLFRAGNYAQAGAEYAIIGRAQPENTDARFFHLYSLFLGNKLDRDNYRQIKEGLQVLERNGYYRQEIREVLEYIAAEESSLSDKTGDSR